MLQKLSSCRPAGSLAVGFAALWVNSHVQSPRLCCVIFCLDATCCSLCLVACLLVLHFVISVSHFCPFNTYNHERIGPVESAQGIPSSQHWFMHFAIICRWQVNRSYLTDELEVCAVCERGSSFGKDEEKLD